MTRILPCSCKHPYQDRLHGAGKRVHNETMDHGWRCTVCGAKKAGKS